MNNREIRITTQSEVIHVSAEALWEIVGPGFAKVGEWTSSLKRSTPRGDAEHPGAPCAARVCFTNIPGYERAVETLTSFDSSRRELSYEMSEGAPGFLVLARNHWKVRELGPQESRLEMHLTLRLTPWAGLLLGGVLRRKTLENVEKVFPELKVFAETGLVAATKQEQINQVQVAPGARHVKVRRVVEASHERVWEVIGSYNQIHRFHPFVRRAEPVGKLESGVGARRECHLYSGASVVEEVVDWQEGRSVSVLNTSSPSPFGDTGGTLSVAPLAPGRSVVLLDANYEVEWGLLGKVLDFLVLRFALKWALNRVLRGLKHYVETGEEVGRGGRFQGASRSLGSVAS